MRRSILQSLSFVLVAILCAAVAQAQLSPDFADWADGPAGFLLTKKEKKQWDKISTDAEAEKFIDLFWARRNPNPDTSFNTFKAEFDAKVRYAEENFSYPGHSGATTDRAKVLILMGRPDGVQNKGPDQAVQGLGSGAGEPTRSGGIPRSGFTTPRNCRRPSRSRARSFTSCFMRTRSVRTPSISIARPGSPSWGWRLCPTHRKPIFSTPI